jgi:hypothetical protein
VASVTVSAGPPTPVVTGAKLVLVTVVTSSFKCDDCEKTKANTLPTITATLGDRLTVADYADPLAQKLYPGSRLIPRWKLTRPDGTTETKDGYLSPTDIKTWIGE